jgi:hypothetical protein
MTGGEISNVQSLILSILPLSMSSWSAGSAATGPSAITPSRHDEVLRSGELHIIDDFFHELHRYG